MSALRTAAATQTHHLKRLGARYQSQLVKTEFEAERQAVKVHAAGKSTWVYLVCMHIHLNANKESAETWKKISTYVCIPA